MSSISKASNVSGAAMTPPLDACAARPWRRSRRRAEAVSRRARTFPRSVGRDQSPSLPVPAAFARDVHAAAGACGSRRLVAIAARSLRRAVGGACGGRAGLADPAGADGVPVGARPRRGAWRRPMPSMAAWRSLRATTWSRLPRSASSPMRASPSSSTRTIPMDGSSPRTRCSLSPIACAGAADCCWSTRPSWMSAPEGASLADHVEEGNIVVLRSFGKFYGLPGLAAELCPCRAGDRHAHRARRSGLGRCRARRSRSARRRSPMPTGGSGRAPSWPRRR